MDDYHLQPRVGYENVLSRSYYSCINLYRSKLLSHVAFENHEEYATVMATKIQIVYTFLVPAHLGSPGQRAVKRV